MMQHVLSALAVVASVGAALAQTAAPPGDAKAGEALFMKIGCYQCHGTVGQGSRGTGPRLAPATPPFENFAQAIRKPTNVMPVYTPLVVSDAQLADIHAYLRGLAGPAKAEDVKILR